MPWHRGGATLLGLFRARDSMRKQANTRRPTRLGAVIAQSIQRTAHAEAATIEHVSVNLRRRDILVAEQFLHRTGTVNR